MIKTNPFHHLQLDKEEQAIETALEKNDYQPVKNAQTKKTLLREAASHTLNKTKNINIRLPEKDIVKLKAIAAKEGLPYQTLVSSVLHKFAG